MLSLSSYPFHAPFGRSQHGADGTLHSCLPADKSARYSNWLTGATKGSTSNARRSETATPESNCSAASQQNESNPTLLEAMPKPLGSAKSVGQAEQGVSNPCTGYPASMNGGVGDHLVMTGSSNPRAEQLSWLAEVAAGSARASQSGSPSSPVRDKDNGQPLLHSAEGHASRSSMNSILLGVSPMSQRMYAPYHVEGFHAAQQATAAGISLYHSQASRTAPYPSFYHNEHRVVGDGLLSQSRLPRPYYPGEMYTPTMSAITNIQLPSNHGPLPHSPGYLHPSVSSPSSSPHGRISVQQCGGILVTRSAETILLQEREKNNLSARTSCNSPQYHREDRRKSYKSPEPKTLSPSSDGLCSTVSFMPEAPVHKELPQPTSSPHLTYKVPTGKEGSLKHRILRPPSINIVDPPPTILDAPLSAPPIRSHSPKQLQHQDGYRSFSTSGSFVLDGSHVLSQPKLSSASFVVPSSTLADCGSQLKYPPAFMKGSIIQLANSQLKPVELMTTEDFLECETLSSNLKIDSSSVISIEKMPSSGSAKLGFFVGHNKLQITVEAPLEHPFFVYKSGWSSCCPQRSLLRYGLTCSKLKVGDTCIFLTVKNKCRDSSKVAPHVPMNHLATGEPLKSEPTADKKPLFVETVPSTPAASGRSDSSKNNSAMSTTCKKRKRRWSAPSEVSHIGSSSD